MIKILIISHVFREERTWKRWKLLSEKYDDIDVTLLAPKYWEEGNSNVYTFGKITKEYGKSEEQERFRVRLIDMRQNRYLGWMSFDLINQIRIIKPDLIYHIGHHLQISLTETIIVRNLLSKSTKIAAFSMRGLPNSFNTGNSIKNKLLNKIEKIKWNIFKKNCDAVFCHYPSAKELFIKEGINKPIYIQTQIGVDSEVFKFTFEGRREIRNKYGISDAFVFGSASRFSDDKGLLEILRSLPRKGNWKYLMLGSGTKDQKDKIEVEIDNLGLRGKVILPGFIEWNEMPKYLSAMDCFVHVPRTTEKWVETFSLAIVQAMAVGLPVIGNSSGSVPYQIGEEGIIVQEGNIDLLSEKLTDIMNNLEYSKELGELMRGRVLKCFEVSHLTDCFYFTVKDILSGIYDSNKIDMTNFVNNDIYNEKSLL